MTSATDVFFSLVTKDFHEIVTLATRKEGNVLFDASNTFYLCLFGVGPFREQEKKPAATTTWVIIFD